MQYVPLGQTAHLRFTTEGRDGELLAPSAAGTPLLVVNGVEQSGDAPPISGSGGVYVVVVDTSDDDLLTGAGVWAEGDHIRVKFPPGGTMTVDGVSGIGGWIDDEATVGLAPVSVEELNRDDQSLLDLKDFADAGYDPSTNKVQGVVLVDTTTTNTDMRGTDNAYTGTPPTANAIADQVWDEATTGHTTAGTFGAQAKTVLDGIVTTLSGLAAATATAVWGAGARTLTAFGFNVTLATSQPNYAPAKAGDEMDLVDAPNATAVAAIQNGLATGTDVSTAESNIRGGSETLESLKDDIASIGGGSGPGPWAVVIRVESGGTALQNADVMATNGSEEYTVASDSSGDATFSLPTDGWDFYPYKPNYVYPSAPFHLDVSASTTSGNTIDMTYDPPGQELTEEDPTMTATFLTKYDLACHLRDVIGGDDGEERNRSFSRAVSAVHLDFFGEDGWKESLLTSRIEVQAAYSTGTIAFDLTGGSSERLITLSGGTFPSWAGRGSLIIDDEIYRVTSRLGNTTLQLDETFCPTADIASGTAYILFQDSYLLPPDCAAIHEPVDKNAWSRHYIDEEEWLRLTTEARFSGDYRFTIMHDDRVAGRYAARFFGYPSEARTLSFLYKRVRKTPVLSGTEANSYAGTIAYTNGSATITGTNTAFSDRMVGAVLRIGDASNVPTDLDGDAPYYEEHVIGAVASTTSLTLKTAVGLSTASSIKYRVSDPVSFDRANHLALRKGAEAHYWLLVKPDSDQRRSSWQVYQDMKMRAHEQQSRHRGTWSPVSGSRRGAGRPSVNVNAPS